LKSSLIDYDVGSNWETGKYIAGVGADQEVSSISNLEKQTEQYGANPDQHFIKNGKAMNSINWTR